VLPVGQAALHPRALADARLEPPTFCNDRAKHGEHELVVERGRNLGKQPIEQLLLSARIMNGQTHCLFPLANAEDHLGTFGQHLEETPIDPVDLDTQVLDL
jgi:hypothetical protein